jgi:MFS family permease
MIWPFMMIYASQRLQLPLTAVASLLTINSALLLVGAFLAGTLADRVGRRGIMIVGMALHGAVYFLFSYADSLWMFAVLMAVGGFVTPVYRVGVDAMVADLIPQERRVSAFALLRTGNNAGVAIGPSIGGFLATQSYSIIFYCAASGLLAYSLFTFLFLKETIPQRSEPGPIVRERFGGYLRVASDRLFVAVCAGFIIATIGASLMFVLLAVYAKTQFGLPESRFGFIMATNAAMVVVFQVMVTSVSRRFPPYLVMALGSLLYAVGVGSVALVGSFAGFMASMIILTCGELLLVPTTSALVANLAPPDMRGRYMSIYGLSWGVAAGIGPVFGGFLNDAISPGAIWAGGALVCMVSVGVYAFLALRRKGPQSAHA